MRKILLSVILLLPMLAAAQAITTSGTTYTAEGLVNQVLLNDAGIQATNVTFSTGTNFGSVNGLGYFTDGGGSFPFENGVILSTGNIALAPGPNPNSQGVGTNTWPGDSDALAVMQQLNPASTSSFNATKLEFDFTAVSDHMMLDYIFTSEEYGDWQCSYSDAFVIMLTDLNTGIATNLGVIPGTTTPVTSTTIRSSVYNSGCGSLNAQYFGAFYSQFNTSAPINFNGRTVPLVAEATLTPGHNYHVKIAIADRNDFVNDSALFLNRMSFNIPVAIGAPQDLYACDLNNDGVAAFNLTLNNDAVLDGQDTDDFVISYFETQEDAYDNANIISAPEDFTNVQWSNPQTVYVRLSSMVNETFAIESFQIVVLPSPVAGTPAPLVVIDNDTDGQTAADLTTAETEIMNGLSNLFFVSYYTTQQDAEWAANPIQMQESYTTSSGTLYFRLEGYNTGCYDTGEIEVIVLPVGYVTPPPVIVQPQEFTEFEMLEDIEITGENILWYATATGGDYLPEELPLADGATYYASQTIYGIESVQRAAVTITLLAVPDAPTGQAVQYFYIGATIDDLAANGENIQWYEEYDSETPLAGTEALESGWMYYATQTIDGVESYFRLGVTAYLRAPAPVATPLQAFAEGATLDDIAIEGEYIQWYATDNYDSPLANDTPLEDGVTYYATQTIDYIESIEMAAVTITFGTIPGAPAGEAVQYFFDGSAIDALAATGENILWYSMPVGGNPLPASALLANGNIYYASQTVDGLESNDRLAVTAYVTSPPPVAEPEQTVGEGSTLADLDVEGADIQWYNEPGLDIPGPPNTMDIPLPLTTVLVDGETYHASQTINGIESVQRTAVTAHLILGSPENAFDGFACFPNPVKDVLYITNTGEISSIAVYNLVGQLVFNKELNSTRAHINLENLANGVYLLNLRSGTSEKTIRIIKE